MYCVFTNVKCTAFIQDLGNKRRGFGINLINVGSPHALELTPDPGSVYPGQLGSIDHGHQNGSCVSRSVDRLPWRFFDLMIEILDVSVPNRTPMVLGQVLRRYSREIVIGCSPQQFRVPHPLPLAFINHDSVGHPVRNPGASFPSFLISHHQPVSAGHSLAIPFDIPRASKKLTTRSTNSCPFSQNVLPSHSFDFYDFHSVHCRRHCSGMEIALHLPVRIERRWHGLTTPTSTFQNYYRPLRTPCWCRPSRLQT